MVKKINIKIIIVFIITISFLGLALYSYFKSFDKNIPIRINSEAERLYEEALKIQEDSLDRINKVCKYNEEKETYTLNKKYKKNKDYKLINDFLCTGMIEELDNASKELTILNVPKELSYKEIKELTYEYYNYNSEYYSLLNHTDYEIIYEYYVSLLKGQNDNDFYNLVTVKTKTQREWYWYVSSSYEKILNNELNTLEFFNNTIKYFENELN